MKWVYTFPAPLTLALALTAPLRAAEPSPKLPTLTPPTPASTPATPAAAAPESPAQVQLRALIGRQRDLLAQADRAVGQAGVEDLRLDFQKLVKDYESYLGDYPDVAAGYVSYALLLGKPVLGERDRAAKLLLKANELDPTQPLVKNQLGNYLAENGEPLKAEKYYQAAIELAPTEPLYQYQLGNLLVAARDEFLASSDWPRATWDAAMQNAFNQARKLDDKNLDYALAYGKSFFELAQPDWSEAMQYWRTLESKTNTMLMQQTIRLYEAAVRLKQGDPAEARTLLATVDEPKLANDKQRLIAQLPAPSLTTPATSSVPALPLPPLPAP